MLMKEGRWPARPATTDHRESTIKSLVEPRKCSQMGNTIVVDDDITKRIGHEYLNGCQSRVMQAGQDLPTS